jgi:diguanylate cyclase (GGDEF)-like protein/PAS domain S-box-containing protein
VSATADPVPGTALLRPAAVATEIELFSVAGHDGTLRKVNHAFARLLGLTPDELDGRSMLELVHPDDLSEVVAALSSLEAGAPEVLVENRFLVRHASAVHLEWVARPFGDTGLWWAAGRDTTRFHRLLAERTDLRARLDLALGQATAGMWEMDPSTGVLSWEPQALQVLGLADGQGHGPADAEALAARVHDADAPGVVLGLRQLATSGGIELSLRVGDAGSVRHVSLRGKVLERDRRGRALRAVGLVVDVTAEKAMEEQLLRMVMSDALTGVQNRRAFDQTLRGEWRRCTRAAEPLTVMMIDIDDFKRFNDTFGHLVGDEALCAVARAVSGSLQRAGDVLARFGGEEFALVLPGISHDGAAVVAQRLLEAVRAVTVRQAAGWQLSVSVGSATWTAGHPAAKALELLGEADEALYAAKRAGKDQAVSSADLARTGPSSQPSTTACSTTPPPA